MNLVELFQQGGPLMWVILATSVIGAAVFLERLYTLQRGKVVPRAFVDRIRMMVVKGQTNEARLLCEENGSSIALMIAAAVRAHARGRARADAKEAVDEVGNREVARLDKNVEIVGTVASVSPLLGLLGTVVGMIQVFKRFVGAYDSGQATPDVFAQGIWTALITTAYGLTVAIPMLILYKWLQGRNDQLIAEMEEDAMAIVDLLEDQTAVDGQPGAVVRAAESGAHDASAARGSKPPATEGVAARARAADIPAPEISSGEPTVPRAANPESA